jgi:hypothetical protein
MIVCVDFDGTVVEHKYPYVGSGVPNAEDTLKKLVSKGHQLILFTMRSGKELEDAVKWYVDKEIPLYGINVNPTQKQWTKSPKAYGQLYIDDCGLGCPLTELGYVDWLEVEKILIKDKIL